LNGYDENLLARVSQVAMSRIIALIVVVILVAAVLGVILGLRLLVGNKSPSSILNQTEFQYYLKNPTIASPIGIASYGIYNYSGRLELIQ